MVRVPFRDIDMHGHVHNAIFLSYFEAAINDFLRENRLAAHFTPDNASFTYHVKKAEIIFESPAYFNDILSFRVKIARIGRTSLAFSGDAKLEPAGAICAKAEIVWVCVGSRTGHPTEIPQTTRSAISGLY